VTKFLCRTQSLYQKLWSSWAMLPGPGTFGRRNGVPEYLRRAIKYPQVRTVVKRIRSSLANDFIERARALHFQDCRYGQVWEAVNLVVYVHNTLWMSLSGRVCVCMCV
jgi:hypothetical protein